MKQFVHELKIALDKKGLEGLKVAGKIINESYSKSNLKKSLDTLEHSFTGSDNEFVKSLGKSGKFLDNMFRGEGSIVGRLLGSFITSLGNLFADAMSEIDDMTQASRLSNASTRELALGYGMSASEIYGLQKAMDLTGLSSLEDIQWAMNQNNQQFKYFQDYFKEYTQKYVDAYNSDMIDEMERYNMEMKEFKEDMKMSVVQWLMDHKDLLKAAMEGILKIGEFLANVLGGLFGGGTKYVSPLATAAASNNTYSNTYKNANININNTFNTSSEVARSEYANAGMLTYEQTVMGVSAL